MKWEVGSGKPEVAVLNANPSFGIRASGFPWGGGA